MEGPGDTAGSEMREDVETMGLTRRGVADEYEVSSLVFFLRLRTRESCSVREPSGDMNLSWCWSG